MNFKKFISVASAVAMLSSIAVTASAATYQGVDVKKPFNNTSGTVAASGTWSYVPKNIANTVIVEEFDLYVADGDKVTLTFQKNSSGTQGAQFIFDASAKDGTTYVKETCNEHKNATAINGNSAYAQYETGATAHVLIESNVGDNGYLTDHNIYVSNVGSRVLTNNTESGRRAIDARNLRSTTWGNNKLEITTVNEAVASWVKGGTAYVKGLNATKLGTYTSDEGADADTVTAFTAEMENITGYLNIYVDDVKGTVSAEGTNTTHLTNADVILGIIAEGEHDAAVVYAY